MYKHLETNILSEMMQYNNVEFPKGADQFPSREEVLAYVRKYAETVPSSVNLKLNSNITSLIKNDLWQVEIENTLTGQSTIEFYDAVVISNGHFDIPYIPDVEGLKKWNECNPGSISHAKYFDEANEYKGKNVLVIGNNASGIDIATQSSVCAKKVYVSSKDKSVAAEINNRGVTNISLITKYDYEDNRSVTTVDSEKIQGIDYIIFCTGYLYSIPFLKSNPGIITDGDQVHDLYQQIFYINDPSLSFVALPKNVVPMPVSESQGAIIARVYSGRLKLPSKSEMGLNYEQDLRERGSGKNFHNLKFPIDVEYCQSLQKIIEDHKLDDKGLIAPVWDKNKVKNRSETAGIKAKRFLRIVEHTNKLRDSGEDFRLLTN